MQDLYGKETVTLKIQESYRNMNEIIREHMEIIEIAKEAIRENGIEPTPDPIRGGTDGATLSHKGLPCPNLGTGGYAYHGPMEHVTVEGMETVVRIIKKISEKSNCIVIIPYFVQPASLRNKIFFQKNYRITQTK